MKSVKVTRSQYKVLQALSRKDINTLRKHPGDAAATRCAQQGAGAASGPGRWSRLRRSGSRPVPHHRSGDRGRGVAAARDLLRACRKVVKRVAAIPEHASRRKRRTAYRKIVAVCEKAIGKAEGS